MGDVFIGSLDGHVITGNLRELNLVDEGTSAYFPNPRCYVAMTLDDGSECSLSSEVIERLVAKHKEWKENNESRNRDGT